MPEAAVDEDCNPSPEKHDIRRPTQSGHGTRVGAEATTERVQCLAKRDLRFRVARPLLLHTRADTGRRGERGFPAKAPASGHSPESIARPAKRSGFEAALLAQDPSTA